MSRVISFVAGAAAFAGGFGITPQLPQSIDHRPPVHYLAPPAPDVAASMAATIVDRSRKGDRLAGVPAPSGYLQLRPSRSTALQTRPSSIGMTSDAGCFAPIPA
jgi:hypothetical protein